MLSSQQHHAVFCDCIFNQVRRETSVQILMSQACKPQSPLRGRVSMCLCVGERKMYGCVYRIGKHHVLQCFRSALFVGTLMACLRKEKLDLVRLVKKKGTMIWNEVTMANIKDVAMGSRNKTEAMNLKIIKNIKIGLCY